MGVGVGVLPFKLEVDRAASAGGAGVTSSSERNFTGPTGSLGVDGRFLLGDRWYLESDIRGIAIKIDRIDAKIVEGNLAGRYLLSDKLGVELGYGISPVTVTVDPPAADPARGSSGRSNIRCRMSASAWCGQSCQLSPFGHSCRFGMMSETLVPLART